MRLERNQECPNPKARVLQLEKILQQLRSEICAMPRHASVRVAHVQDLISSVCFDNNIPNNIPVETENEERISA